MASPTKLWADTPFPLVSIPGRGVDLSKVHESVYVAREMAFAHNGMIRSLNSIYQQCIHVSTPADIADLLKYTQFWCGWIHEHHKGEESFLFPQIEAMTGINGLMQTNVGQHHAFEPGLLEFERWVNGCDVESYDGVKCRGIIESFADKLTEHLAEEIQTLLDLKIYDGPQLKKVFQVFDLEMRKGDKAVLYPIAMGTADGEFEHAGDWPEIPEFVRYLIHYYFERKHRGAWRFNPSTTWGKKRPLHFVENPS